VPKKLDSSPLSERRFLNSNIVRKLLGYSDSASFFAGVRTSGIPHIVINRKKILFDEIAVNAWLESRTVGKGSQ
jgi:hypothetical protein